MKLKISVIVSLSILALGLFTKYAEFSFIEGLQNQVFDSYQKLYPREYKDLPIRIVDIDDESLARHGQWPWSRDIIADMVTKLSESGAAAIAFDIIFAEPDRTGKGNDDKFAQAIKTSGNVVTSFFLNHRINRRNPNIKTGFSYAGEDPKPHLETFRGAVTTLPEFEKYAAGNGSINASVDNDGIIRRMPLFFRVGNKIYPTLTAEALRVAQGASTDIIKSSGASGEENFGTGTGLTGAKIGAMEIPTDSSGKFWIHYTKHVESRYIPAWKVLGEKFDPASIKGSIIFVGTSAAGLKDLRATPLNPTSSGVEVHAQALEQVLLGTFLTRPDWMHGAEITLMVVAGLILIFAMARLPALWGALFTLIVVSIAIIFSLYMFAVQGMLIDPVTPSIVIVMIYISQSLGRFLQAERERKMIHDAFSHYMSPALVKELAKDPKKLKLGGETRNLTVMFCDIRDFTSISENMKAASLTKFINSFLTPMTDVILEHRGTIDKYMGDCIMAFWNAPLPDPRHASRACAAALEMLDSLEEFNKRQKEATKGNFIPTRMGIGLNTGTCSVGNMGSQQRFDYSVLGDDVNLASRLEGQSKNYGVDIVIGADTAEKAKNVTTLELDLIKVKGKNKPVKIYALLGKNALKNHEFFIRFKDSFESMLKAYRKKKWKEAKVHLGKARKLETMIKQLNLVILLSLYEERIKAFMKKPPPPKWNGVFEATNK